MFTGSFSFKGISTNSCLSTKCCPWSGSPGSLSHNWTLNSAKLERLGSWPFGPPSWLLAFPLGLHSEEQQWALPVTAVLCRVSWGFVEGVLSLNLIFTRLWALHPASLCQARCTHSKIMAAAVTQQTGERESHGVGLRRGVHPLRCRRAARQGGYSIYFRTIIRMQGSGKWKLHSFH